MQLWQLASAAFFLYVALIVLWRGGHRPADRRAMSGAVVGLVLVLVSVFVHGPLLADVDLAAALVARRVLVERPALRGAVSPAGSGTAVAR